MRYIGNKQKIIAEIDTLVLSKGLCKRGLVFCDAFSGTSAVSEHFKNKFKIIANDNLYMSFVMSQAKLNTPDMKFSKLGFDPFDFFNESKKILKGFIYNNYSLGGSQRMYFSENNAARIDFIRREIENWQIEKKITDSEYYYLIACLLESVSKVSNVAGVYGSFLKTWDSRAVKDMKFIKVEQANSNPAFAANDIYNLEIENLISELSGDILYLDPPYTHNQYSVQYHILETIAKYDNPKLSGKTGAREVSKQNSKFSKYGEVHIEFEKIIAKANFKHIILSYSQDGIMSKEFIEKVLKRHCLPETLNFQKIDYVKYQNHRTSKTREHFEYLFYIEKNTKKISNYASPLNYIGGKASMVDCIRKYAPKKIYRFVDLFGGGFNVGLNFNSEQIIYNDCNVKVKELIEYFFKEDTLRIIKDINSMIKKYRLEKANRESYLKLRDYYNSLEPQKRQPKMLYALILFGFNQQIRFNSALECNNPVGEAGYNDCILEKLVSFCRNLKDKNVVFESRLFQDMYEYIDENSFVYCDPPYLLTLGSYNDGKRGFNGWNDDDENFLLNFLTSLDKRDIKFMLSNVLEHNGKENAILRQWLEAHKEYNLIDCSAFSKRGRREILITNYRE